jgi:phosphoglycolate phosphatase
MNYNVDFTSLDEETKLTSRANVLFDLDGTLTDPKPGITACIRFAMEQLGRPLLQDENLDWCIGPPLQGSFAKLLAEDEQVPLAMSFYRERFQRLGMFENSVYAGIDRMLEELSQRADLWLATSKPRVFAEKIAAHFGLDRYLKSIYGSELDGSLSDKGELIFHLLKQEGLDSGQTVMVVDREHDILGAKKNGLSAIGVLWGYGSEAELAAAGADRLVRSPGELQIQLLVKQSDK